MVIKQFVYLTALAREQHFGRAAEAAHVSQPTLSAAIRNLEDELGVPVVERGHRFNGFTPEGLVVLDYAKRVLAECEAMRQTLEAMGQGLTGRLRLGGSAGSSGGRARRSLGVGAARRLDAEPRQGAGEIGSGRVLRCFHMGINGVRSRGGIRRHQAEAGGHAQKSQKAFHGVFPLLSLP